MSDGAPARGERKWQKPKRNWLLVAAIALGVTGVLYVAARFTVAYVVENFLPQGPYAHRDPLQFSNQLWLATAKDKSGTRYLMLDDLLKRHPLVGLTRDEVVALLGPFEPPGYPGFPACYYLGPENHPFREGTAWLVLTLDADQRVRAIDVQTK
ncbi:MAG: hypothetical protein IT453_22260 [Planctomycetes bacterium]|nr:hypothetical protein [Planctomycetota bacterium]